MPIREMCTPTVVDLNDDATVVSAAPAYLLGVYVNTVLSAHALLIKDGDTALFTIPATAAAGTLFEFSSPLFKTSLVLDPDDAATGNVTVMWCPA